MVDKQGGAKREGTEKPGGNEHQDVDEIAHGGFTGYPEGFGNMREQCCAKKQHQ